MKLPRNHNDPWSEHIQTANLHKLENLRSTELGSSILYNYSAAEVVYNVLSSQLVQIHRKKQYSRSLGHSLKAIFLGHNVHTIFVVQITRNLIT